MDKWLKFVFEREIFCILNVVIYQVTGSGYNDDGDVLCHSERITYDSHPSISKIVEVKFVSIVN
jgi:hypothetical protein